MDIFNKVKHIWFRSDLLKNISTLVSGAVIAQLIPIILQPVLRRVFSPEEFGVFAVYMSIIGIVSVIFTMRYEQVIPIADDDKEASKLYMAIVYISSIFFVIFLGILFFFKNDIAGFLNFPVAKSYYFYWLLVASFLFAHSQAVNYFLVRKSAFRQISFGRVYRRIAEGVMQILFGIAKKPIGLVLGDLIGSLFFYCHYLYQSIKLGLTCPRLTLAEFRRILIKYKDLPLLNLLPHFLNTASFMLPIIIISNKYDSAIVGYFDLTRMVLAIPFSLLALSVSQVFYNSITESKNGKNTVKSDYKVIIFSMCSISVFMIILIELLGPFLFKFVFGNEWGQSGQIARLLVITASVRLIVSPLSIAFIALDRILVNSIWQVVHFLAIVSLFLIPSIDFKVFILIYVIVEVIFYIVYFFLIKRLLDRTIFA